MTGCLRDANTLTPETTHTEELMQEGNALSPAKHPGDNEKKKLQLPV